MTARTTATIMATLFITSSGQDERCFNDGTSHAAHALDMCWPLAWRKAAWVERVPPHQAYVWTADFHVAPMACDAPLLESLGAVVHGEVDFSNCRHYPSLCHKRLKVLGFDDWRGFGLEPCPQALRRRFFDAYKRDAEFWRVDLFVCSHPAANCELLLPFNRSLLVHATTRLEFGRDDALVEWRRPFLIGPDGNARSARRWTEWVKALQAIASNPRHTVAVNNRFDQHYIKFHTGIDAQYLPSWCEPPKNKGHEEPVTYNPLLGKEVLLVPYRDNLPKRNGWKHPILAALERAAKTRASSFRFRRLQDAYTTGYSWADLAKHPALVFIPYQVSTMFFFEAYRLNLPIFAPSLALLSTWVRDHGVLWERIYGTPQRQMHDSWTAEPDDPNSSDKGLEYWLGWSDFYHFDHIILFDSWEHCLKLLESTNFRAVSAAMKHTNIISRVTLLKQWGEIIRRATMDNPAAAEEKQVGNDRSGAEYSTLGRLDARPWPLWDYDNQMKALWPQLHSVPSTPDVISANQVETACASLSSSQDISFRRNVEMADMMSDRREFGHRCASWTIGNFRGPKMTFNVSLSVNNMCLGRFILIDCGTRCSEVAVAEVTVVDQRTGHLITPTGAFMDPIQIGEMIYSLPAATLPNNNSATSAIDGNSATYARSSSKKLNSWIEFDLGASYAVDSVTITLPTALLCLEQGGARDQRRRSLSRGTPDLFDGEIRANKQARRAHRLPEGVRKPSPLKPPQNRPTLCIPGLLLGASVSVIQDIDYARQYAYGEAQTGEVIIVNEKAAAQPSWCRGGVLSTAFRSRGVCCAGANVCGGGNTCSGGGLDPVCGRDSINNTATKDRCCVGHIRKHKRCCFGSTDTGCLLPVGMKGSHCGKRSAKA